VSEIAKQTGYTPINYVGSTPVPGVSLATTEPGYEHAITGLLAGETIAAGDACYIKASDGRIWRSTGAAANAAAVVDGFAAENCTAGEALTLYRGVHFNYSGGLLTPGTSYYLSGTVAGGIADAASTGGTTVIARAMDASRVLVKTSY
jgi:hypothetical protein